MQTRLLDLGFDLASGLNIVANPVPNNIKSPMLNITTHLLRDLRAAPGDETDTRVPPVSLTDTQGPLRPVFNAELRPSRVRATPGSEEAPGIADGPALQATLPWTHEALLGPPQNPTCSPCFIEAPVNKEGWLGVQKLARP